eukprot:12936776-Prorocentrum_lima.AAC.1
MVRRKGTEMRQRFAVNSTKQYNQTTIIFWSLNEVVEGFKVKGTDNADVFVSLHSTSISVATELAREISSLPGHKLL